MRFTLLSEGETIHDGDLIHTADGWKPAPSGEKAIGGMAIVRPDRGNPDVTMKVWIDSCGIQADVNQMGTGSSQCGSFSGTYSKPGQVANLRKGFHDELWSFIEEFRQKH